jgi:hypothetical protein
LGWRSGVGSGVGPKYDGKPCFESPFPVFPTLDWEYRLGCGKGKAALEEAKKVKS